MVFKLRSLNLASDNSEYNSQISLPQAKKYSLRDLKKATNNFSPDNIIGRGGFGEVFKGILDDGSVVAIKRLLTDSTGQFTTEVDLAGLAAHRNLARLRGSCITNKESLLVYPFMTYKSVASCLRERRWALDWNRRKRIALGVAKGLAHMHYGCAVTIIHRDVKLANVLLDEKMEAVVTDFGLVKFIPHSGCRSEGLDTMHQLARGRFNEQGCSGLGISCWPWSRKDSKFDKKGWRIDRPLRNNPGNSTNPSWKEKEVGQEEEDIDTKPDTMITTSVCGTTGHLAPEYILTGKCSVKTDVFGYGIMLLELITAQRAFDLERCANAHDVMLLDWVKGLWKENKLERLVDSNLHGISPKEKVRQLIQLALLCTHKCPELRPKMTEVVAMLAEGEGLDERWEKCVVYDEEMNNSQDCGMVANAEWISHNSLSHLSSEGLSGPR